MLSDHSAAGNSTFAILAIGAALCLSVPTALIAESGQDPASPKALGEALMRGIEGVESLAAIDLPVASGAGEVEEDFLDEPARGPEGRYDLKPGWWRVKLGNTNAHFDLYMPESLYLPASLPPQEPAPMPAVVFLHGAGATTSVYHRFLSEAAEESGVLLALPKSQSHRGWGYPGDAQSLFDTLVELRQKASADPARIAIAGHSAGGAFAYQHAYLSSMAFSAVFTLGAPFLPVVELRNPDSYVPPIRMYYGTEDYNLVSGDAEQLVDQWRRLGVEWEFDLGIGYGHNTWPAATMFEGFDFLSSRSIPQSIGGPFCEPSETTLCLHDGRFEVTVQWRDSRDRTGLGSTLADLSTDQSGLFWFFSEDNWEVLLKIIDGCSLNDRYWVLSAATTDVAYTLTVRDLVADETAVYRNLLGDPAPAIVDTSALASCPPKDDEAE